MEQSNFEIALTKCFFCGGDNGLVMNRRLTPNDAKKIKEMNGKVVSMDPCPKCAEFMKQGIILLSCKDGDPEYRTGRMCVVKEAGVDFIQDEKLKADVLKRRFCIIEDTAWKAIGLPMEEIHA